MPKLMEHDGTLAPADNYHVVVGEQNRRYYFDNLLKKNIDFVKVLVKDDWDALYIGDGEVGAGKSCFTQQAAFFCSEGNITYKQVCFTPRQFIKAIKNAPKYSAVIFDEAFRGLSSRAAMSQTNKAIVSMLQEIRQKNLFVFVLLPSIWDLDSYVAKHRTRGLFHIHTDKKKKRGFFKFYSKEQVLDILKDTKNKYKYYSKYSFHGRYYEYYPIEGTVKGYEYKKLKKEALESYGDTKDEESIIEKQTLKENRQIVRLLQYTYDIFDKFGYKTLGNTLNLSENSISGIKSRLKQFISGDMGVFS